MRRRRNPSVSDAGSIVTIGLVLGLGFLAYKYLWPAISSIGNAGAAAVDSTTTAIANLFPGTSPSVQLNNVVLMPDGTKFPAQNLTDLNFSYVNGQAQFIFNGATYALTPQVNGVYQAIAI